MISRAEEGVNGELSRAHGLMVKYLPEKATQVILFGPIRANVLDALGQLETLINAQELATPQRTVMTAGADSLEKQPEPWSQRLARLAAQVNAMVDG